MKTAPARREQGPILSPVREVPRAPCPSCCLGVPSSPSNCEQLSFLPCLNARLCPTGEISHTGDTKPDLWPQESRMTDNRLSPPSAQHSSHGTSAGFSSTVSGTHQLRSHACFQLLTTATLSAAAVPAKQDASTLNAC